MKEWQLRRSILDKPAHKPLDEVKEWVRRKVFEPKDPIKLVVIERGRPGVPIPVDRARDLYVRGEQPETLVDGFARSIRHLSPERAVSMPEVTCSS